ncbi:hypothetical protein CEE44_02730 [Candidatus Woesearchaeota archaeon B3_Woes]|nr:MAG: hypothetical protein CEE44_02730 [Candidatus Woesearchaeota archaeon B3_Woes]
MKFKLPTFFKKNKAEEPEPVDPAVLAEQKARLEASKKGRKNARAQAKKEAEERKKAEKENPSSKASRGTNFYDSFSNRRQGGSFWWVIAAVALYFIDIFVTGFKGFEYSSFVNTFYFSREGFAPYVGFFTNIFVIGIILGYILLKKRNIREAFSFFVLVEGMWLILAMNREFNIGAVLHLVFGVCVLIWVLYYSIEDRVHVNYLFVFFLFCDFFLFSALEIWFSNIPFISSIKLLVPVWFLVALLFARDSGWKSFLWFVVIMFYVLSYFTLGGAEISGVKMDTITGEDKTSALKVVTEAWENLKESVTSSVTSFAEGQANATLGEYYTGDIDRKARERLGVYIEDLQGADTEFYEDQPVNIWATLVAKTLDEPIEVEIGCTVDGEVIEGVEIYPKEVFDVESFEEEGIECSFEPGLLIEGYHEISMNAKFNFLTMAYIKTYFMDPERRRALMREGIDPLENYGIVDRDPRAVYTNGPIMIGLDVGKPPLSADKDFRLGTTLTNWWDGEIQKVTDFYIVTPNEMELEKNAEGVYSCRGKRNYIFDSSSCSEIGEEEKGCDDKIHNVFKIESDAIEIREIENYETILCRLYVQDQSDLLGEVPLVTKYLKVVAKYDYNIHEEIGIQVKGGDGVRTVFAERECTRVCIDDDGCLCPDGCEILKGQHIYKDMTCGGIEGGEVDVATTPPVDVDGGEIEDVQEDLFAVEGCGGNEDWTTECKLACNPSQHDGIFCFEKKWTCTTDANEDENLYYPLALCKPGEWGDIT